VILTPTGAMAGSHPLTVNGTTYLCSKKATINVLTPTVNVEWPKNVNNIGLVLVTGTPAWVIKLMQADSGAGMTFSAGVKTPPYFGGWGEWQFTQLVTTSLILKDASTGLCTEDKGVSLLDGDFSYPQGPDIGPFAGYGTIRTTKDSPQSGRDPTLYSEMRRADEFRMYLMYRPPATNGVETIWVPLKSIGWQWSFCAAANGNTWNLVNKSRSISGDLWVDQISHPTWTGKYSDDLTTGGITCPSPCAPESL